MFAFNLMFVMSWFVYQQHFKTNFFSLISLLMIFSSFKKCYLAIIFHG